MNTSLLSQIETYVTRMLGGSHEVKWPFHNIHHVKLVVEQCRELARAYDLDQQATDELLIAAWFHDIGYVSGSKAHEVQSCKVCLAFLDVYEIRSYSAFRIVGMILATKYPSFPITLQEKILCDADLYHLASDDYTVWAERLCQEVNQHQETAPSRQAWLRSNIGFFETHHYATDYARMHWTPGKLKNLSTLKAEAQLPEKDSLRAK